jgi:TPP-dependent pyruvate/acetoin dehydrogenase alpha subunit
VLAAIDDAVEFALESPYPDASELHTDVYAAS